MKENGQYFKLQGTKACKKLKKATVWTGFNKYTEIKKLKMT